jgi:cytochrome c
MIRVSRQGLALALCLALPSAARAQAGGDALRGAALYEARCGGCHSLDANRVGPMHRGVFGRRAGSVVNFDYSDALRNAQLVWNERTLDAWLADPQALIPGQKMGYALQSADERAEIVAWLARGPANWAARE